MILKACACVRQGTAKGPGDEGHSKWAISIVPGKVCPQSMLTPYIDRSPGIRVAHLLSPRRSRTAASQAPDLYPRLIACRQVDVIEQVQPRGTEAVQDTCLPS